MSGSPFITTANQSGEMLRLVNWVIRANRDIQNKEREWNFLRQTFFFNTTATVQIYAPADAGIPLLQSWKLDSLRFYNAAVGTNREQWMIFVQWEDFRDLYLIGANRGVQGPPRFFAIQPNKSIIFWPIPDDIYTIDGEYFIYEQPLVNDSDVPLFPQQFHDVIMFRALMWYAAYEEDGALASYAKTEYMRLLSELECDQLPAIQMGEPLV